MIFYFKITKHIQCNTRKLQKNKFNASFQFYFLCIFLGENLVSKYEQLLILPGIDASTLVVVVVVEDTRVIYDCLGFGAELVSKLMVSLCGERGKAWGGYFNVTLPVHIPSWR